ncbi:MAG: hypothetical protein HPY44_20905 [Armatimonadetes bacterium]|nr:hypothetical protein [Armatimonadota bacterium]
MMSAAPVAAMLLVLSALPALAARSAHPAGAADIPLDGTVVSLPAMQGKGEYQVRLSGTFECEIDGRRYDARYRQDATGDFVQPHDLVVLDPPVETIAEDSARHTYTFGPVSGKDHSGKSITIRVDVDRLVDEFIRTPSEVRESLSGDLEAELLYVPPAVPLGVIIPSVAVPLLLLSFVITACVQASRHAARRPYEDVHAMRRRIQRKMKLALEEVGTSETSLAHLRGQLRQLGRDADELARHVIAFREARLVHSEADVQDDIDRLEHDLQEANTEVAREQIAREIRHKQETLKYLQANAERESDYLLRLSGAEATLDNLRLKLSQLRLQMDARVEQEASDEVENELELLRGAVAETRERVVGENSPLQ